MKTIYIPADAAPEVKENLEASQQGLEQIQHYQAQSEAGTLNLSDLEELAQKQAALSGTFTRGDAAAVQLPSGDISLDDLEALARQQMEASLSQAEQSGGPAYQVNSLEELQALAALSFETAEKQMIKKIRSSSEGESESRDKSCEKELKEVDKPKTAAEIKEEKRCLRHLEEIGELLELCKDSFFDLSIAWPSIKYSEEMFVPHLEGLKEQNDSLSEFLSAFLADDSSDTEKEKKQAAAFALTSIDDKHGTNLKVLLRVLKEVETLRPVVIKAFKYGLNPYLDQFLGNQLMLSPADTQADIVDILYYRGSLNLAGCESLLKSEIPEVRMSVQLAFSKELMPIECLSINDMHETMTVSEKESYLFSLILSGQPTGLNQAREILHNQPADTDDLPLFLSLGCNGNDIRLIERCLKKDRPKFSTIKALGILGLSPHISLLIEMLENEEWEIQRIIVNSLELITGACLDLPIPKIKEGPPGKEHVVTVVTGWRPIWSKWWYDHHRLFENRCRYRRGAPFTLESCIREMAYPTGNWWSRQFAYYELKIRSGKHVTRFEADWYVEDQQQAIDQWQKWWEENHNRFGDAQWLFGGN